MCIFFLKSLALTQTQIGKSTQTIEYDWFIDHNMCWFVDSLPLAQKHRAQKPWSQARWAHFNVSTPFYKFDVGFIEFKNK